MCSIFGSFREDIFVDLAKLNQFKGNFSCSITQGNRTAKDFGKFNKDALNSMPLDHQYLIGHVQAPTGGMVEDRDRIHPTTQGTSLLWHNGLLTSGGIKYLQGELDTLEEFDTKLLHEALLNDIDLSNIEGLFSCVFKKDHEFFIFRTKHGKLYIDEDLNLSSERFPRSKCINYDTVYRLDFRSDDIEVVSKFKTKKFNYIIEGETNEWITRATFY